jgi:hypothetical protein
MNSIISAIADERSNICRCLDGVLVKKTPAEAARRKKQWHRLVGVSKQDVSHSTALAASPCLSLVETDRNESITSHHHYLGTVLYDRSEAQAAQHGHPKRKARRGCAEALR